MQAIVVDTWYPETVLDKDYRFGVHSARRRKQREQTLDGVATRIVCRAQIRLSIYDLQRIIMGIIGRYSPRESGFGLFLGGTKNP